MVSQVQLGNFFSSGGKTVLGGVGGSGFDTESLIKALADAKRLPAVQLEDKIKRNNTKASSLAEFKTLLSSVQDAANFLRNPPGVGNAAENVFRFTTASVISNSDIPGSIYMNITASPGAALQSYNIGEITSTAKAKKQKTGSFLIASAETSVVTAESKPGYFRAGTITVNGASITLNAGDSLNTVVAKFNQQKTTSGIEAAVVQVGAGDFVISFSATTTGLDADFNMNDGGTVTDVTGVLSMIGRTNLITNGSFDSSIASWTNASLGTGAISYDSGASNLVLDGDGAGGNEAFAQQSMTTVIGQQYTVRATLADLTSSAYIRVGSGSDVTNGTNFDVEDYEVTADGEVMFTFTATSTTTYLTFNSDTNTDPITVDNVSVVANATQTATTTQTAANAVFELDGITITRQGNSISDVVDGVTFNLLQATPVATELAVSIQPDEAIVRNGIINFVNAYNELKIFAAKQTEIGPDGTFADTAVLSDSQAFRTTMNAVSNQLASLVNGISGSNPSRLADVGITFIDLPADDEHPLVRNILNVDDGELASAISSNFEGVRRVFEFDFISDNTNLRVFSRTNALNISSITLNIDPDTDTFEATYDDGSGPVTIELDATAVTGTDGYTLRGKSGTVLEGLVMVYSSSDAATIEVTMTQGLADKVYNSVFSSIQDDTGIVTIEAESLESSDAKLTQEIARIDEIVERFRQQLLEKFGALEAAIARVNTLLQSLDAQDQARANAS